MKVYVAGPMTGYPDFNFPAFADASARLRALGYEVVSPAEVCADQNMAWIDCMRADIRELVLCDAVAVLPGWEKSRGATLEVHIAQKLGLPVFDAATMRAPEHVGSAA